MDCFPRDVVAVDRIVDYESESNISFNVINDDVNVLDGNITNKDNTYIGAVIKTLKLKIDYFFNSNKYIDSEYKYSIDAVLKSYEGEEIVWKKVVNITEKTKSINKTKIVKIDEIIDVPFNQIYKDALKYKEYTGREVILDLEVKYENSFKVINESFGYVLNTSNNTLRIPITNKTFNITNSGQNIQKRNVETTHEERTTFNSYLFSLAMICFVSIIPVTILSYVSLFNLTNYDEYKRRLRSIKKKYSIYIVSKNKTPVFKKKEIIEVDNVSKVVDHVEEDNIVLFEKEKGKEAWFYLENKKEVYLYILKLEHNPINMEDNTVIKGYKKHKK